MRSLADLFQENDMGDHDTDYCEFREIKTVVVTWNVGAATPTTVRYEEKDSSFFREVLQVADPPDLLVFGFQELVDLEDKKLTASSYRLSSTRCKADTFQRVFSEGIKGKIPQSKST